MEEGPLCLDGMLHDAQRTGGATRDDIAQMLCQLRGVSHRRVDPGTLVDVEDSGMPRTHSAACRQTSPSKVTSTSGPVYVLRAISHSLLFC